ncbi:MAG: hypothetical protein IJG94_11395 [Clostridia bacterium]|nr:hypothetical protein [Clostridia bacterium]
MKKIISIATVIAMICVMASGASAGGWTVPNNHSGSTGSGWYSGITVQLIEDLATRSGPSTTYTGCGSYKMKGQYVTALARAYDNGGVLWVEVEFSYGGGYRRAWTGAKRLDISASQLASLPETYYSLIGYGTITCMTVPRFGPGSIYSTYSDRNLYRGDMVAVITEADGYYLVECYHTDGHILRCWIPVSSVE